MTSKKQPHNIDFYHTILKTLLEGKDPIKELKISKQKLYYYTRKLRDLGFLKKQGNKFIVITSKKANLEHALNYKLNQIRGHAFIWKVKPSRDYDWIKLLNKNKIPYKLIRGQIPRAFFNNKKVWLAKDSIIVYETKSFYGKNAIQSRKYAVFELQATLEILFQKLGIRFNFLFKPTREHFGMIKNELARQCNKNGEKIIVRDALDGEWFWIDDSTGMMGEMETGGKGITMDRAKLNMGVQKWWNEMKQTNFEISPKFLMETINKVTQNQKVFDANMMSHLEVLENIGKAITELRDEVSKLNGKDKSNK